MAADVQALAGVELADGASTETFKVFAAACHERVYKLEGHERIEWDCHVLDGYDVVMSSQVSCAGLQQGKDRVREVTERERCSEFNGYLDLAADHIGWLEEIGAPAPPSGSGSPAVLKLMFDNTYSFFTPKHIEVRFKKVPGAAPRASSYLQAINVCEAEGRWQRALMLLDRMQGVKLSTDTQCFNATICACRAGGRWREALSTLASMRSSGPSPDADTYDATIAACEVGGQAEKALELVEEMSREFPGVRRASGSRPNGLTAKDIEWMRQTLNEAMTRCPFDEEGAELLGHLTAALGSLQSYTGARS